MNDFSKLPALARGDVLVVSGAVTEESVTRLCDALKDIGYGYPGAKILVLEEGTTLTDNVARGCNTNTERISRMNLLKASICVFLSAAIIAIPVAIALGIAIRVFNWIAG